MPQGPDSNLTAVASSDLPHLSALSKQPCIYPTEIRPADSPLVNELNSRAMQLRQLVRWAAICNTLCYGIQLYFRPADNKDALYAWLLQSIGYLCFEFGWPHQAAGSQLYLVLQLLSISYNLPNTSRVWGVDLRFWQRAPEICEMHVYVTQKGGVHIFEEMVSWDGVTSGFWCRTRRQQVGRMVVQMEEFVEHERGTRCLRSCVRYEDDGRWHLSVESAPAGKLQWHMLCREGEGELFGQCPGLAEAERPQIPLQVEWLDA